MKRAPKHRMRAAKPAAKQPVDSLNQRTGNQSSVFVSASYYKLEHKPSLVQANEECGRLIGKIERLQIQLKHAIKRDNQRQIDVTFALINRYKARLDLVSYDAYKLIEGFKEADAKRKSDAAKAGKTITDPYKRLSATERAAHTRLYHLADRRDYLRKSVIQSRKGKRK